MNIEEERPTRAYEVAVVAARPETAEAVRALALAEGIRGADAFALVPVRLAYPIRRMESAWFGSVLVEASPDAVSTFSRRLKLEADVVRFLILSAPREERKAAPPHPAPEVRPAAPRSALVLSNEALEAKIEEILK